MLILHPFTVGVTAYYAGFYSFYSYKSLGWMTLQDVSGYQKTAVLQRLGYKLWEDSVSHISEVFRGLVAGRPRHPL
jgi:hypothetical protein